MHFKKARRLELALNGPPIGGKVSRMCREHVNHLFEGHSAIRTQLETSLET